MNKPYGRKIKKEVGRLLRFDSKVEALKALEQIPDEQLTGHLFSYFYNRDELVKFRSTTAMGELGCRLFKRNREKARIILRRIMWNLNDESGGIGWGSPEAMGEILSLSPELALEFKSILFSYLDPDGNYLEHEMLQRGVIWGIGTYLKASPQDLSNLTENLLYSYTHSKDPVKRGYSVRALINAGRLECSVMPENILKDGTAIFLYDNWCFRQTAISEMALSCTGKKFFA